MDAHEHQYTASNLDTFTDSNSASNCNVHGFGHTFVDCYGYTFANSYVYSKCNVYCFGHAFANINEYTVTYFHIYVHCHSFGYAFADIYNHGE